MGAKRGSRPRPGRPRRTARKPRRPSVRRPSLTARSPAALADREYRRRLAEQLGAGYAHVTFADAVKGFPVELRGRAPAGAAHSPWQVLEHMRITQWDILNFCRDPEHVSPVFPDGYWPAERAPLDAAAWDRSLATFAAELEQMRKLVLDPRLDLHVRVSHPEAKDHHTLARESLVLANHNSYHLGELVLLRRLLGTWP